MKIKRNVPLSPEEKIRKEWPFTSMEVNDVYDIKDKSEWPEASKYAHTCASKKGWKFHTTWMKKQKVGRIRRVG